MTQAYPLTWPPGWPRTPEHKRDRGYQFKHGKPFETVWKDGKSENRYTGRKLVTFAAARDKLMAELARLGATDVIISSNHIVGAGGIIRERKTNVSDEGIAVYFKWRKKQMVMACDRFSTAAANMSSLRLAIDALRQLERHGGGTMMERAFTGFEALPAPKHWTSILGVSADARREDVLQAHKRKVKEWHSRGGPEEELRDLNISRDQALEAIQ